MNGSLLVVILYLFSIIFSIFSLVTSSWPSFVFSLVSVGCLSWVVFSDSMNSVQTVGKVYWIVRDNAKKGDKFFSTAFMRTIENPWLIGKGIQLRVLRYSFQIGTYYILEFDSNEDGVLNAMQGRFMDEPAKKIGNWK